MAATATVVASIGNASSVQTTTTASFTPTANTKLVAVALTLNDNHTTAPSFTFSGGSLSWTNDEASASFEVSFGANFDLKMQSAWADVGGSPSAMTVTVDPYSGTELGYIGLIVFEVQGAATGASYRQQASAGNYAAADHVTVSLGTAKTTNSVLLAAFFYVSDGGVPTWDAAPSGWTRATPTTEALLGTCGLTSTTDADASLNFGHTLNTTGQAGFIIEVAESGGAPILTQSHYRFGLDDGNEAAHTFAAAEDTPITADTGVRRLLRVQVDETAGAAAVTGYSLQYRRVGDPDWRTIE